MTVGEKCWSKKLIELQYVITLLYVYQDATLNKLYLDELIHNCLQTVSETEEHSKGHKI